MKTAASQIAQTILQQLGGSRFLVMTGANYLVGGDDFLQFKLPRSKGGINSVTVRLDESDTYTVKFHKIRGFDAKLVREVGGVYADSLRNLFTQQTGLYTDL